MEEKVDGRTLHRRTHCKRGHEFTPENTYIQFTYRKKGGEPIEEIPSIVHRSCLECRRSGSREYVRKSKNETEARRNLIAELQKTPRERR